MRTICIHLLVGAFYVGCQPESSEVNPNDTASQSVIEFIDYEAFDALATSGDTYLVLDVRTPGEYNRGHVPGAINIPHNELPTRLEEIAIFKDKPLIAYCESGGRTSIALSHLWKNGFQHLRHLEGDMAQWRNAGRAQE